MTRRTLEANGTICLKSFSYFASGDADEALRRELEAIELHNRAALAHWNSLTQEQQLARTAEFAAQQARKAESAQGASNANGDPEQAPGFI